MHGDGIRAGEGLVLAGTWHEKLLERRPPAANEPLGGKKLIAGTLAEADLSLFPRLGSTALFVIPGPEL